MSLIFLVILIPLQAYGAGIIKAGKLLDGKSYRYLQATIENQLLVPSDSQRLRHIGIVSNQHYFLAAKSEVIVSFGREKTEGFSWKSSVLEEEGSDANK